jgi:hypothetical protein
MSERFLHMIGGGFTQMDICLPGRNFTLLGIPFTLEGETSDFHRGKFVPRRRKFYVGRRDIVWDFSMLQHIFICLLQRKVPHGRFTDSEIM